MGYQENAFETKRTRSSFVAGLLAASFGLVALAIFINLTKPIPQPEIIGMRMGKNAVKIKAIVERGLYVRAECADNPYFTNSLVYDLGRVSLNGSITNEYALPKLGDRAYYQLITDTRRPINKNLNSVVVIGSQ